VPEPTQAAKGDTSSAPRQADTHEAGLLAFYELGRALAMPQSKALGDTIWECLGTHLPAASLVLFQYDESSDGLIAVHEAGPLVPGLRGTRIAVGERLSGWVAATGEGILNSDARLDIDEAARDQSPLRSALAVPIVADGRVRAVLSFYAVETNAFDESHRRLVAAAARAVAAAARELQYAIA
jgi:GAF domain-containing protein